MRCLTESQAFPTEIRDISPNFGIIRSCGKYERVAGIIERVVKEISGDIRIEYRNRNGFQIRKVSSGDFQKLIW